MKRYKKSYLIAWGIAVAVFAAVALLIPQQIGGWSKNEGAFWAAFVMILLIFAGQLGCSALVFRKGSLEQRFLRLPIIYVSYVVLLLTAIMEIAFAVIPGTKNWLGIVLGLVILACYGIAVVMSVSGATVIDETERKVKEETRFLLSLRAEAEVLRKQTHSPEISAYVKKVEEAVRYSDPRSNQTLEELEGRLYMAFLAFSEAAGAQDEEACREKSEQFLRLLEERNTKCRLLK